MYCFSMYIVQLFKMQTPFCLNEIIFIYFMYHRRQWESLIQYLYFFLQVQIPGLENLQVFVPNSISGEKSVILQLLNAAAGKDCTKDSDDVAYEAYLLMTKHSDKDHGSDDSWSAWEGQPVKVVPQVETVDTLRTMQVGFSLFFCFFPCLCDLHTSMNACPFRLPTVI